MVVLRFVKWIGWGLVIWGVGLFRPEIYQYLSPLAMAGLAISLGLTMLAYYLGRYVGRHQQTPPPSPEPKHASRPSRPVPPLSMA
jgi:hypothetical protein